MSRVKHVQWIIVNKATILMIQSAAVKIRNIFVDNPQKPLYKQAGKHKSQSQQETKEKVFK